jgi:transposase InsO family protein
MDDEDRKRVALWRLGVLGPLISARLEHGDRRALFDEAAARTHEMPDGRQVTLSARTVEAWFYAYRTGGFEALWPEPRSDRGQSRAIAGPVTALILRAKREKPRRSVRRIIRMLERAGVVAAGALHRATVHRLLAAHGASKRPLRGPATERRSFLPEHAGDLLVGDALHGPVVIAPDGRLRKAYLLSQIDAATRFIVHSYFALGEGAVEQEYGLRQALLKHGPPRMYYVDRGPAYTAESLREICAELGIHLLHTGKGDAEAKGVIERWHRTWREEVEDELPQTPLPLAELESKHWAWLGAEYHARKHDTTGRAPREHWLAEVEHLRALPAGKKLDDVFLHRAARTVRKDGTVRFAGGLLEVRAELVGRKVELRFDPALPASLPRVFVDGRFYCDTVVLDRHFNFHRRRRRDLGQPEPQAEPSGLDPLALIEREHYDRVRPAGAPASQPRRHDDHDQEE